MFKAAGKMCSTQGKMGKSGGLASPKLAAMKGEQAKGKNVGKKK